MKRAKKRKRKMVDDIEATKSEREADDQEQNRRRNTGNHREDETRE